MAFGNPIVLTSIAHADPNASPISVNDLIDLLNQLLVSEIQGSYKPYIMQHDTPSVEDQDKAWIELTTQGIPKAIKVFYNGVWRRVYNGMIGEIRGYSGNPNNDFDMTGDNPGIGKIGGEYDGWYLCNGLNGTPNLSDKFLQGAHMDDSGSHDGYDNGWQSAIAGPDGVTHDYKTGGRFVEPLINANLPLLSNAAAGDEPGLWIYGKEAKEDASHPGTSFPLVDSHYANAIDQKHNLTHNLNGVPGPYGKATPTPVWTLSPFVAVGWIIFKGY